MYEYKNVLIEKRCKALVNEKNLPVEFNFDVTLPPVGTAKLTVKKDGVYADIKTHIPVSGMFPCAGIKYKNNRPETAKIYRLSVCTLRNTDKTIEPIK